MNLDITILFSFKKGATFVAPYTVSLAVIREDEKSPRRYGQTIGIKNAPKLKIETL